MRMDERNNREWLDALRNPGQEQDRALAELRRLLVKGLSHALRRWKPTVDREFDSLIEDFSHEALLRVLSNLDSFEGRSKFTTWTFKIAVSVALTELRRKRWKDVSLEKIVEQAPVDPILRSDEAGPEVATERTDLIMWVRRLMTEELSARQLAAMEAVAFAGVPLEEVARRMDTNRNALYKLIHDARLRLKRRLVRDGTSADEILASMDG